MSEEARTNEPTRLARELDDSLNDLERALSDAGYALSNAGNALTVAGQSATKVRSKVAQFDTLTDIVNELEETLARARQNLGVATASQPSPAPALRAVPPTQTDAPPPQPTPQPEPSIVVGEPERQSEPSVAEAEAEAPEAPPAQGWQEPTSISGSMPPAEAEAEAPEAGADAWAEPAIGTEDTDETPAGEGALSHCLRLGVSSKTGSLDLKAVDGSVNENPAVVDVALLDYDGRQATLKLWLNNQADPQGVRQALLSSLRRRLGDEKDAEVQIDFEDTAA